MNTQQLEGCQSGSVLLSQALKQIGGNSVTRNGDRFILFPEENNVREILGGSVVVVRTRQVKNWGKLGKIGENYGTR